MRNTEVSAEALKRIFNTIICITLLSIGFALGAVYQYNIDRSGLTPCEDGQDPDVPIDSPVSYPDTIIHRYKNYDDQPIIRHRDHSNEAPPRDSR